MLLRCLSPLSIYGAPAECRPSTFVLGTVGIESPWGTYSLGPGKPPEKDGPRNTVLGVESIRRHPDGRASRGGSNTTCLGVFKRIRWNIGAGASPETCSAPRLL